jgi:predicted nucleotidyltransferase
MQIHSEVIEQLVQRIIEEVHPLRILLFGSTVRGEIGPDSDIALLVIMPNGSHRRQIAQ